MKIYLIPEDTEVTLRFTYRGQESEMNMTVYHKTLNKIYLPAIKDGGRPVAGRELKDMALIYHTEQGIFEFRELRMKLMQHNGKLLYEVQSDYDAERTNRREAFRVKILQEVNVIVLNSSSPVRNTRGTLRDISAVGMAVMLPHKIEEGAYLQLVFNLNEKSYVTLVGEIIRTEELSSRRYLYGCKFDERSEMLGKFLLKRQLDYRRRGLKI